MDNNSKSLNEKRLRFINEIKVESDVQKQKILKLQKEYEEGLINEEDLTHEQILEIKKLYNEQIKILKASNEKYKRQIQRLQND